MVSDVSAIVLGSTDSGRQQHIAKTSHQVIATRERERRVKEPESTTAHKCVLQCPVSASQAPPLPFHHPPITIPYCQSVKRLSIVIVSELSRSQHFPKAHHLATQTPTYEPVGTCLIQTTVERLRATHSLCCYIPGVQMSLGVKLHPGGTDGRKGPHSKHRCPQR